MNFSLLKRSTFAALGAAVLTTCSFAAAPATDTDKSFVAKVSQGGAYEVAASKVAVQRAHAMDVKDLAISEVHDHEGVGARLKALAMASGAPISPVLNAEFQTRLENLKSASATDFDAAYIADMESIHDKDEKLFAAEANEGSDAYKAFAHQTDLIVKRHIGALHGLDH
jgi:putative membrane protein